ncbi:MAG: hypothetical protein IJW45_01890 [Oscillospiraceae bacterium]|nr:hypothetical protein [Oscillospiraceae bacterium]
MDMEGWICLVLVDIMVVRGVPEVASAVGAVLAGLVVLAVSVVEAGLVGLVVLVVLVVLAASVVPEGIMAALEDTGLLRPVGAGAWGRDPMAAAAVAAAVV